MTEPFAAVAEQKITEEWFAGFCDGEASLNIAGHGGVLQPRFRLNQRDDDADLVRAIRDQLGVGSLTVKHDTVNPNANPQLALSVIGRDCQVLVDIFDRAPLRSKKRFEYPIWRQAVCIYSANMANRWTPGVVQRRYELLLPLKIALMDVRKYRGPR